MLYWECKRRLKSLIDFRELVLAYFSNIQEQGMLYPPIEHEPAQIARFQINRSLNDVQYCCALVGETLSVSNAQIGRVSLLPNIFNLWQYSQIPPNVILDGIDRAIGSYEREARRLFVQSFNPFFWTKWLLTKVLSIPFDILGFAGFNAEKIEHSIWGKLFKAVAGLATLLLVVLTILEKLDLLDGLQAFLNITPD